MKSTIHVLTGCTAVGKTEWALRWAESRGAEIVSCDSLLFYRGMDIGTAKPSADELARVPHHLINICGVTEAMDVARYGDSATPAYTHAKVVENYGRRFRVRFPNEELEAGRPLRTTPLYHRWLGLGAVMGEAWGMETPLWFSPDGTKDAFSFHRSSDFVFLFNDFFSFVFATVFYFSN